MQQSGQKSLSTLMATVFHKGYTGIRKKRVTELWLKGGRSSTKSAFAALAIVTGIMTDPKAEAIIFRKYKADLRDSVLENIIWAIDMLGVSHKFHVNVAPMKVTYKQTGQRILFRGLDKATKLKSIKSSIGYFKYQWFEELEEFHSYKEIRNVKLSTQRGGHHYVTILTYNPPNDPNAWVNKESAVVKHGRMVIHSTYLDVPEGWLDAQFYEEMEHLKSHDFEAYRHEYLGEAVGRSDQIVFSGRIKVEAFDEPSPASILNNRFFYGVDWGFAQDDMAVVRCFIRDNNLYVDYEAGGVGIEITSDNPDEETVISTLNKIPGIKRGIIKADSNRPELISYVHNKQYNIKGVKKWTGIVEDSVAYLKSFEKIIIHPRCTKLIYEMQHLSYKVDRHTDEILPQIADGQSDHYFDALRYAIADYIQRKVSILDVV